MTATLGEDRARSLTPEEETIRRARKITRLVLIPST